MTIYREYKDGDEKEILTLYNDVFRSDRDEDYWNWQFNQFPFGESIIFLGEDNGKIIGQTTLIKTTINYNGNNIEAGYSIDSMVDREYRRKGIFSDLEKRSYEIGRNHGLKFKYGFPIYGALIGLTEKLGASLVDDIPVSIRVYKLDKHLSSKLRNKTLAKLISIPGLAVTKLMYKEKKIKAKDNYVIKEIKSFDKGFDILWDELKDSFGLMTPRTSDFLNWRIANHPTIKYNTFAAYLDDKLLGYMVVRIESKKVNEKLTLNVGHIMDMLAINDNVLGCIYFKAKEFFKQNEIDFVLSWAGESMKYRSLLVDLGFYKTRTNIPFVVKEITGDGELEKIVSREINWHVLPIESDIY